MVIVFKCTKKLTAFCLLFKISTEMLFINYCTMLSESVCLNKKKKKTLLPIVVLLAFLTPPSLAFSPFVPI